MAQKKSANVKKRKQKRSFILTLALFLLIGYFVITIVGLQLEIRERKEVKEQLEIEHQQFLATIEYLQSIVDNEDKGDYMEQIAREKLGFVMPNEKVFYDITPGA
ncbi:MAG: septum formation initiator family protein [Clostridia bacterium]|nr:septum formation initiator family protein [Clostridia bacterium]